MHLIETCNSLFLAGTCVEHVRTSIEMSLISSDISKTTNKWVSCNLEDKTCKWFACIRFYLYILTCLRISTLDSTDIDM